MSRNDWDQLPDKGPQIEEPRQRHRKKGGGKKPFILQARYIHPQKHHMDWMERYYAKKREWHTYQRYKTEKAREEALKHLTHRAANSHTIYSRWEYRIPPDE